jgi:hypothetical protein
MEECREADTRCPLGIGAVFVIIGIALVGVAGLKSIAQEIAPAICLTGFMVCLGGLSLIWKDLLESSFFPHESNPRSEGMFLGRFRLNSYCFEAYEREMENGGREFHLVSSPPSSHHREAAFVRYLVNEGLIENWWPERARRSRKRRAGLSCPKRID